MHSTLMKAFVVVLAAVMCAPTLAQAQRKPNLLVIWGDDIGRDNISAYSLGIMGYKTRS